MPLKQLSRKVVYANTAAKEDRVSLLKPINQIQDMDDDSGDDTTFGDINILTVGDLYQLRPVAQFAQVGDAYA